MPRPALLDAQLVQPAELPASAGSTYSAGIDTGARDGDGLLLQECEVVLTAPALSVTQLPNSATATYVIQHDADPAFGTASFLTGTGQQVGAGGIGATANSFRFRLPSTTKRYVRGACTTAVSPGDCSAASFSAALVF